MRALVLACLAAFLVLGCGPVCPFPDPYPDGSSCLDTCATDNSRSRKECESICARDECQAEPSAAEEVAIARDALTHAASRVYAISSLYYQTQGCAHGAIATDSASRCNSPIETLFVRVQTDACPPGSTPTLTFTRTEWQHNAVVDVRNVLRTVVDPPAGISSACADPYPGAKWDSTGAGAAWSVPGAKGIGTDVSTEKVTFSASANGDAVVNLDLRIRDDDGNPTGATLIDACAPSGECLFAFHASAHIWEAPGTFSLAMTCAGPAAVCGDGAIAGAEACDDGGTVAGDGCSATCAIEAGYTCSGAPSVCVTTCGDGVKAGAEECDDGAANGSNAPCSAACAAQVCGCSPP